MAALKNANRIRVARAAMKVDLKAGRVTAVEILADPPGHAMSMKLQALLVAVPKFGVVKANRVMNRCRVSTSKTVGGLSERQRNEIILELEGLRG